MRRNVSVRLEVGVSEPALLALQIAVATPDRHERLSVTIDGATVPAREVAAPHDGRMHVIQASPGHLLVDYEAEVSGHMGWPSADEHDQLLYRRPSRYCPSDRFLATAAAEFGGIGDTASFVAAVTDWVHRRLIYIGGSSGPSDDAVDTMLLGEGVCRDYAHVVVSLLRARDVPARLAAVYAPGLDPMDFHAVAEAWVDGGWRVVDATRLAPRTSMLRIATGRDAADTAFLSVHYGKADLRSVSVVAVADQLPYDEPGQTVALT